MRWMNNLDEQEHKERKKERKKKIELLLIIKKTIMFNVQCLMFNV